MKRSSFEELYRSASVVTWILALAACAAPPTDSPREATKAGGAKLVSTNLAVYPAGSRVTVTYTGMSGSTTDWISIAAVGSPAAAQVAWSYTGGGASGSLELRAIPPGTYEARAFYDWMGTASYTIQQVSAPFTVGAPAGTATTNASAYAAGVPILINYTGLPGVPADWVDIAPAGSPVTTVTAWKSTGGGASGQVSLRTLVTGTYVARTFSDNTFNLIAESAPFTVAAGVVSLTPPSGAIAGASLPVGFSGFPGGGTGDWIAVAPAGSPATTITQHADASFATSGTVNILGVPAGLYEARGFFAWPSGGYAVQASAAFTVETPIAREDAATFAAGYGHSCAIKNDATLWCWGWNASGQLGDGTFDDRGTPSQVGAEATWTSVAAGGFFTCGRKANGTLWCWGANAHGQLGDGTTAGHAAPAQVGTESDWTSIYAGQGYACARKANASLWCWGLNAAGQIGDGTTTNRPSPTPIRYGTPFAAVSARASHTCARTTEGALYCWGSNASGQLGDGTTTWRSEPAAIATNRRWRSVSVGIYHTCALDADGGLSCWGGNAWGQIGDGTTTDRLVPTAVAVSGVRSLAASAETTCARGTGFTLTCWGGNAYGQLGDGTTANRATPGAGGVATDWAEIAGTNYHACGKKLDGSLWCWGGNFYGQLGNGTTTGATTAIQVF